MLSTTQSIDITKVSHHPHHAGAGEPAHEANKPMAVTPVDRITLSKQALEASSKGTNANRKPDDQELTPEEQEVVNDLKQRDTEVKTHEQAHMSAGAGVITGGASYQ